MHMSRRQIKNWIAYPEGVEEGLNDTNRMELKVVAESLCNRLFDIIKNVLPDNEKDQMLRFRLRKTLRDTLEHFSRLPGMGNEVHELLNTKPWPTNLTKDAMCRVYLLIAGYTRDVLDRWVYIRRDYRLETEEEPEPGEGNRVVKNADVRIIKSSCQNMCKHTLNYDNTGNSFLKKDPKMETAEPFSTDEDECVKARPSSTSTPKVPSWTPKDTPRAGQDLAGPRKN